MNIMFGQVSRTEHVSHLDHLMAFERVDGPLSSIVRASAFGHMARRSNSHGPHDWEVLRQDPITITMSLSIGLSAPI
jgi:hypothetical protein